MLDFFSKHSKVIVAGAVAIASIGITNYIFGEKEK